MKSSKNRNESILLAILDVPSRHILIPITTHEQREMVAQIDCTACIAVPSDIYAEAVIVVSILSLPNIDQLYQRDQDTTIESIVKNREQSQREGPVASVLNETSSRWTDLFKVVWPFFNRLAIKTHILKMSFPSKALLFDLGLLIVYVLLISFM